MTVLERSQDAETTSPLVVPEAIIRPASGGVVGELSRRLLRSAALGLWWPWRFLACGTTRRSRVRPGPRWGRVHETDLHVLVLRWSRGATMPGGFTLAMWRRDASCESPATQSPSRRQRSPWRSNMGVSYGLTRKTG